MRSLSKVSWALTKSIEWAEMLSHQLMATFRPLPFTPVIDKNLQQEATNSIHLLEKCLTKNIAQFWLANSIDDRDGGYRINLDRIGKPAKVNRKGLVTQARMLWLFSRLSRSHYAHAGYIQAAHHGFEFLSHKLWDQKHQGFFWEVDITGAENLKTDKHLYGQAFALYALSEYYLVTQSSDALRYAETLFDLLDRKAYDSEYGGYREHFDQQWQIPPQTCRSLIGVDIHLKTMNTHLHLLEAITNYYRATHCAIAQCRILELLNILTVAVNQGEAGAFFDQFHRDWTLVQPRKKHLISYGHGIESIWLLLDACQALNISPYPFLSQMEKTFSYAMRYGYDWRKGGFYEAGYRNRVACRRNKIWWVQAEAMVGALYLYAITHSPSYLWVFNDLVSFVDQYLIDWQMGEWHNHITPTGKIAGMKADLWKAGYHNGRAVLFSLEILSGEHPIVEESKFTKI